MENKMNVKQAMGIYFDKLISSYSKKKPSLPSTPYDEDVDRIVYVGEPDEEEWILWKPVLKTEKHNLPDLLEMNIHSSVIEYYNSYWFCSLGGRVGELSVQLDEVLPNTEIETFTFKLLGYKDAHNGLIKNIPIGIETNQSLLIVVDNTSGEVKLEDYERKSFKVIAKNLSEIILLMSSSFS